MDSKNTNNMPTNNMNETIKTVSAKPKGNKAAKNEKTTPADIAKQVAQVAQADSAATSPEMTVRPARSLQGFQLPHPMVDVRGWKVMDSDGHELGAVESLMVETDSSNIRWVAVRLSDTMLGGDAGSLNAVLIPVGRVRMLAGQKSLALVSIARDMLLKAPKLPAGAPATREMEDATLKLFGIATSNELPKGDLYGTPAFDAKLGLLTPGVATGA